MRLCANFRRHWRRPAKRRAVVSAGWCSNLLDAAAAAAAAADRGE